MRRILILGVFLLLCTGAVNANDLYIAQNGTGSGTSCTDARSVTWMNTSSNWGSGASQAGGPDNKLHLCGTLNFPYVGSGNDGLIVWTSQTGASGTAGHPFTVVFESGAILQSPQFSIAMNISGGSQYVVVDGGVACGPGTTCANTDTGTGIIQNTDSGSLFTHCGTGCTTPISSAPTFGVYSLNCDHCEVKNLIIRNLFVQDPGSTNLGAGNAVQVYGTDTVVHDLTIHDVENGIWSLNAHADDNTFTVYNYNGYHMAWGLGTGYSQLSGGLFFHNNHIHDLNTFDTPLGSGGYHKNGIHSYNIVATAGLGKFVVYNNIFDGNWGSVNTAVLFCEGGSANCMNSSGEYDVFNNVIAPIGDFPDGLTIFAQGKINFLNNTVIGASNAANCIGGMDSSNLTFKNNIIEDCGSLVTASTAAGVGTWDYNMYANAVSGNPKWSLAGVTASTLANWQSGCGCDSHSQYQSGNWANLNPTTGMPVTGFAGSSSGANLSASATGALASLANDMNGTPRPGNGNAWTVGAYVVKGSSTSSTPTPPFALIATVQ